MGRLSRFFAVLAMTVITQAGTTLAQDLSFRDYPSSSVFNGPNVSPKLDTDGNPPRK